MNTAKEIQQFIFSKCGLKTGVRTGKGSMKGYLTIYPIYQNGTYPSIPADVWSELKVILISYDHADYPLFCGYSDISVYGLGVDREHHNKENKPKAATEMKVRQWGSKNSQMRLDKASARYANKRRGSNGDNMVKYW